jgi:hypothetical protein
MFVLISQLKSVTGGEGGTVGGTGVGGSGVGGTGVGGSGVGGTGVGGIGVGGEGGFGVVLFCTTVPVLFRISESFFPVPLERSPGFNSVVTVQLKSVTGGDGGETGGTGVGGDGVVEFVLFV